MRIINKTIKFGIGCFHFGIKKETDSKIYVVEYFEAIKRVLNRISSITNLEVDFDQTIDNYIIEKEEKFSSIEDANFPEPKSDFLTIGFEIYIPFRIQQELSEILEEVLNFGSEKFYINIIYSWNMPVVYIQAINPKSELYDPSDSVQIVREYLRKEFKRIESEFLDFQCLGPSPFHANFMLIAEEEKAECNWNYKIEQEPDFGYSNISIIYNPHNFVDIEDARNSLLEYLESEFGFYYLTIVLKNKKMRDWIEIENDLVIVSDKTKLKGIKKIIFKLFHSNNLMENIITKLISFESNEIVNSGLLSREYNSVYNSGSKHVFKKVIDENISDDYNYPINQSQKLIDFYYKKKIKRIDNFIIIISALIGGIIGSIVTNIVN